MRSGIAGAGAGACRGTSLPAVATVQSIANQLTVASATWTQTISAGSSSAH